MKPGKWLTNNAYDFLQIDTWANTVQHCKGNIKFSMNKLGEVNHMWDPIVIEYGTKFKLNTDGPFPTVTDVTDS